MTADQFEEIAWKTLLGDATADEQAALDAEIRRAPERAARYDSWRKLTAAAAENLAALHDVGPIDSAALPAIPERRLAALLEKLSSPKPPRRPSFFSLLIACFGVAFAVLVALAKFAVHELPLLGKTVAHTGAEIAADAAKVAGHTASLGRRLVALGLPVAVAHALEQDDLRGGRLHNTEEEARRLAGRWKRAGDPEIEVIEFTADGDLLQKIFPTTDLTAAPHSLGAGTYTRAGQLLTVKQVHVEQVEGKLHFISSDLPLYFYLSGDRLVLQWPASWHVYRRIPDAPPKAPAGEPPASTPST